MHFSQTYCLCGLLSSLPAHGQSVPGASFFLGGGHPNSAPYQLVDDYEPATFFSKFNFYDSYDPTYGHVQYVSATVAEQNGFVTTPNDTAVISVDTTNKWPNGGPGRPAVRLISDNTYTHGLFVIDLTHMPTGCGTWPAYWLLGPNWPYNGEIDIIEGVHTSISDSITLHSGPGCTIDGAGQLGTFETYNCDSSTGGNGCGTELNGTLILNNYGSPFNVNGGGVYATEWTSAYIKTWFFPRGSIPTGITNGQPNPADFGEPDVNMQSGGGYSCNIDSKFNNMSIIINTDFCGAWAGQVYRQWPNCPQNASAPSALDACVDYVGNNPQDFTEAFWQINSIRVYQMNPGIPTTSSYSTSLPAATPATSAFAVNHGMGGTTSTFSTTAYTGPLSSITTSVGVPPTPIPICPTFNHTQYTDLADGKYTIGCGYDFQAGAIDLQPGGYQAAGFEQCLERCDTWTNCTGLAYAGGNGAGVCYLKGGSGSFISNGGINAAIKFGVSISAASLSTSPTSPTLSARATSSTSMAMSLSMAATPSSHMAMSSSMVATSSHPASASSGMAVMSSTSMAMSSSAATTPSTFPSSAAAGPTGYPYACPQNSGQVVQDLGGVFYIIDCGYDTTGGSFNQSNNLVATFNDCFELCDAFPNKECTAFTWFQPTPGAGGFCFFKSFATENFTSSYSDSLVGAIVLANYVGAGGGAFGKSGGSNGNPPPDNGNGNGDLSPTSTINTLPTCGPTGGQSPTAGSCQDDYGNDYSIAYGEQYTGEGIARADSSDIDGCLTVCDQTKDCVATNFMNGTCSLLSSVNGTNTASIPATTGGPPPAAATRAASAGSARLAPPCPPDTISLCSGISSPYCMDPNGATYNYTCGVTYQGTVVGPAPPAKQKRQTQESNYQGCANLCDNTTGCEAFNYIGTECTMFSNVTGTISDASAVAGTQVSPPTSTTSSNSLTCPKSDGSTYVDTNGITYTIGCWIDYYSGNYGGAFGGYDFQQCVAICDSFNSTALPCVGVEYDTTYGTCQMKNSFLGSQSTDLDIISAMRVGADVGNPAGISYVSQQSPPPVMTTSMPNEATVTQGGVTVTMTMPVGQYTTGTSGYTFAQTISSSGSSIPGNGTVSLCFTCAITPTVVINNGSSSSTPTYGGVTFSSTQYPGGDGASGSGNGQTGPAFGTSFPPSPTASSSSGPSCPASNGTTYAEGSGAEYDISCDETYSGTVIASYSAMRLLMRRTGASETTVAQECLADCDANPNCIAISGSSTTCTLFSSVSGSSTASGSTSALMVLAPGGMPLVNGKRAGSSGSPITAPSGYAYPSTCSAVLAGVRTMTVFTTETITSCGPILTCPASGYVILGGNQTQSGQEVVTTTDTSGHLITYTQIPIGPALTSSISGTKSGSGGVSGSTSDTKSGLCAPTPTDGSGNGDTPGGSQTITISGTTTAATFQTVLPTCPCSNHELFLTPMGRNYYVECNTYFTEATIDEQTQDSLASCISSCDMYNMLSFYVASPCMGVSFFTNETTNNCQLKAGSTGIYIPGVESAVLVTPYFGPSNTTEPSGQPTIIGSMTPAPSTVSVTGSYYDPSLRRLVTTVTVTTISESISIELLVTTDYGATLTVPEYITVTESGSGVVTLTEPTVTTTVFLFPSTSSSSFTCRTYATNYLNGQHGKIRKKDKRSIWDTELSIAERQPRPGLVPKPW